MQPSTAQSTQSAESLDAVLGRFQAWSDSRNTDSHKTRDMTDGIRELSYEDALQSSPYRWQVRARLHSNVGEEFPLTTRLQGSARRSRQPWPICANARFKWSNCGRRFSTPLPLSSDVHVGPYPWAKLLFRLPFLDWRELRDFWNACDGESLGGSTDQLTLQA